MFYLQIGTFLVCG